MNQTQVLSLLTVRRLRHAASPVAAGVHAENDSAPDLGAETPFFLDGVDHQELGHNLGRAVERAWLTMEVLFSRTEVAGRLSPSGRQNLEALFENRCFECLLSMPAPFRQEVRRELRAARKGGRLLQGEIDVEDLLKQLTYFPTTAELQRLQDLEWYALWQMGDELRQEGYGDLKSILEARTQDGDSLLVGLVAAFVPSEALGFGNRSSWSGRELLSADHIEWLTANFEPLEELLNTAADTSTPTDAHAGAGEASIRLRQGIAFAQRGAYEQAIVEFSAAIHSEQVGPSAYVHRGDAYRLRGEYERAIADYSAALRLSPANVPAYVNRAMVHRLAGRAEASVADFTEAIRLDARNVAAFNGRGAAYADLGQHDKAIEDHSQALRLDPSLAWAYQSRGDAHANRGDYDLAIADYSQALRINTHLPLAYANRGDAYRCKEDLDRAIADYTEALRLDPLNPRVLSNRAETYRRQEKFDRALADYGEAIRIDPTNPAVYLGRGITLQQAGQLDRAVADFDRAEQFDSSNPDVFYHRALARQEQESYSDALTDLDRVIELNPRDIAALISRGSLHRLKQDLPAALEDFTEAIRLNPSSSQAYLERGRVQVQAGEYEAALSDCASALEIDPQLAPARLVRGGALLRAGDYERSLEEFNEAIRINPRYGKVYNDRGVAYTKLNRLDDAIADFTRALKFVPDYAQALANRATAYQVSKQHKLALCDYGEALQLDSKYAAPYCLQRGLVESEAGRFKQAVADFTLALLIDPDNAMASSAREEALSRRDEEFDVPAYSTNGNLTAFTLPPLPKSAPPRSEETSAFMPAMAKPNGSATDSTMTSDYQPLKTQAESVADSDDFEVANGEPAKEMSEDEAASAIDDFELAEPQEEAKENKPAALSMKPMAEDSKAAVERIAEEARRRFEADQQTKPAAKPTPAPKKKSKQELAEEQADRMRRYKQIAVISISLLFVGYWGVRLVSGLMPSKAPTYTADKFLGEYLKNNSAADEKFSNKYVIIRGTMRVVKNPDNRGLRFILESTAAKDDLQIECFMTQEEPPNVVDGGSYVVRGRVLPLKPGVGVTIEVSSLTSGDAAATGKNSMWMKNVSAVAIMPFEDELTDRGEQSTNRNGFLQFADCLHQKHLWIV